MNKKSFIILAIVLIVVVAMAVGYCYYQKVKKETTSADAIEQASNVTENLGQQASQGVLPSIDPQSNPMENAPDTNPMSKTNPFSGIKTNPF